MLENIISMIIPVILILLVLAVLAANIRVVPQSRAFVIERLGAFQGVWGVGLHFKIPFIERVAKNISLKEQVVDFPPQPVITKDNVTMQIDTVIYFQITDPKLYTYGVENPMSAIENLTATTLRNIIGDLELDQSLTSRDTINSRMRSILDEATDPWGIKVNRVELKNIIPPKEIQNAMEKQMKAERERRESILQAEGQKQSQILVAEGEKQSAILRADAAKQAAMEELFAALCEREGISVDPIRGMGVTLGDPGKYPAPRGFRHKAATPFAPGKEGAVRCGFFERGTHKIVAVPECPVEAPGARQILNGIAREAERLHIPAFNEDRHLGLLRYAVVRCGWRTDQVMVTLVTAQRDLPHAQEFFEAVAALNPHIVTVAQNINGRPGNAILGEETRIVYGAECMRDQLLGCEFDISPTAFYQTNPQQTELLYQLAIDGMDLQQGDVLMDAY